MSSKSTTFEVVGGADVVDPQRLMDVDRDRKHTLPSSSTPPINSKSATDERKKSRVCIEIAQPNEGKVGSAAVCHAAAASTSSSSSSQLPLSLQQQPLLCQLQQPSNPMDFLLSLEASTAEAAHRLGSSSSLSAAGQIIGRVRDLLVSTDGDHPDPRLDDFRLFISNLSGGKQVKDPLYPPSHPPSPSSQSGQQPQPQQQLPPQPLKQPSKVQATQSSTRKEKTSQKPSSPLQPSGTLTSQQPSGKAASAQPPQKAEASPLPPKTQPTAQPQQRASKLLDKPQPLSSSPSSISTPPPSLPTPSTPSASPHSTPPPPSAAKQPGRRRQSYSSTVVAISLRKSFRMRLPASHPLLQLRRPHLLQKGVQELLKQQLQIPSLWVVDVIRRGLDLIFTCNSLQSADSIVRHRCRFKGTGITIFDILSAAEDQHHAALQPRYDAAVAAGQRAQFCRGSLKIDGKWV